MKAEVKELLAGIKFVEGGIASKTLDQTGGTKTVLFSFDKGQQLSKHTAAVPALVLILKGQADFTLGNKVIRALPGTWIRMPARLPHAVKARTRMVMLLTLLPAGKKE